MDPKEFRQTIQNDGYAVITELCDPVLIDRILATASRKAEATRGALGNRDIGIGSAAGYDEIVQRSPGRWDVPISLEEFGLAETEMPWHGLVTSVLGDDAEHSFSGVVSSDPGSPVQRWHTDSPHISAEHTDAHALNVLVALQDIPIEMGPTEVACASHRLTNHLANRSLIADELIYQDAETSPQQLVQETEVETPRLYANPLAACTGLIFDDRLLHRGLANRSDRVRHVAYFSYRKRGYSDNTHFESTRSIYEG